MNATGESSRSSNTLDVKAVRAEFPALDQRVHGAPLVYLDSGATSQKPRSVIDAVSAYYENDNSNVHRGVHALSERATRAFEEARVKVQRFLGAADYREIVFVRGTTEAINLVAQSYGRPRLQAGDEILITHMEHHANIVPWQLVCEATGAVLKVVPVLDDGSLDMDAFAGLLGPRTRIVAVVHMSNALGTINPVKAITAAAHAHGAVVLLDGAQAVAHLPVDVRDIDCDFYAMSGHKLFSPTGIGVLYARADLLKAMPPWQGGGDMIRRVTFEKTEYNDIPYKFEAGTPDIAGAIGLGAGIDFVNSLGIDAMAAHEDALLAHATAQMSAIDEVRIIGTAEPKAGVLSFVMDCAHAHDIGTVLDNQGIAIRAGHHCAMPLMQRFGVAATARASLSVYNNKEDIDALVKGVQKVQEIFA